MQLHAVVVVAAAVVEVQHDYYDEVLDHVGCYVKLDQGRFLEELVLSLVRDVKIEYVMAVAAVVHDKPYEAVFRVRKVGLLQYALECL